MTWDPCESTLSGLLRMLFLGMLAPYKLVTMESSRGHTRPKLEVSSKAISDWRGETRCFETSGTVFVSLVTTHLKDGHFTKMSKY